MLPSQNFFQLLGYSAHVPLERCRLVKFDDCSESLDQSLDLEEVSFMYEYIHVCVISVYLVNRLDVCIQLSFLFCFLFLLQFGDQTFGHVVNGARTYYSFELYLETRKEKTFKKYNKGGNITPCLFYLLVFIQLFY